MRITMICIGSTGDVRPYTVLGRELKARGHEVSIAAFSNFGDMVRGAGLTFKPIAGDARSYMAGIIKPSASGVSFLKEVRDALKDFVGPFLNDLEAATQDADAVIGTYFGEVFQSLAEVRHIPYIQSHFFPMDKNPTTPISSAPGQRAGKVWKLASYDLGHFLVATLEKYYLGDWRAARGMSPRKLDTKPTYELNGHIIPVLYAISPLLLPRPTTWGANIHMTGFWLGDQQLDYTPDPALEAFLQDGEPPVYIGFGSMTGEGNDVEEALSIVLKSLKQCGVRAVLAKGWGDAQVPTDPSWYVADFVPHDWLFPRVQAVVHHGGAGTTAAGILAGKPSLIIPFGGDQPFWGARMAALGVGPKPIPREKLTVARLAKGLETLTTNKTYRVAARELGERMRNENGAVIAANIIEHELRKWLREEGREPDLIPQKGADEQ